MVLRHVIWFLRIAGEMVSETMLRRTIDSLLSEESTKLFLSHDDEEKKEECPPQYCAFIDLSKSPACYALGIEVEDDCAESKSEEEMTTYGRKLCDHFDRKLQENDYSYRKCRSEHRISSPTLYLLKEDVLTTGIRNMKLRRGSGGAQKSNQIKSKLIISDEVVIDFLKENTLVKVE
ncbi:unnamed protein product [Didymodactylos carnosus]|uniref:GH3 C-terminal domain-containing protein n=1 Tax=Didymodactylos carnosus TaxID=1234261 RepID=A0A8S2DZJ5_9BILA|nr:unnamed protein product [Didymodactylos carnosus]CAF3855185.1 unnamed protein product [Didymodactylos carnosus]